MRMRARCKNASGGAVDARVLPLRRRSVRPLRGVDGGAPSPSTPTTYTHTSTLTSTSTSMCMFYPLGTCCPGPEALLPEALLYCVMRCLRAAQLAAPGLWAVPRMIGPELFECSDRVVPDGRVSLGELPALAECMRVSPSVASLVTC